MTYSRKLVCRDCGEHHYLDCSLDSAIWNQIAEPADVLCARCIDTRLFAKGMKAEGRFYFVGAALSSELYPGDEGEEQPDW